MNRKEFILSCGAECKNWYWSWSFVNHTERFVIFGIWQDGHADKLGLILDKDWEVSPKGRKNPGYGQAIEHIHLIESEGYGLRTFPMVGVSRNPDEGSLSASAIADFKPELTEARLIALSDGWYAVSPGDDVETIAEAIGPEQDADGFPEGAKSSVIVNAYERNPEARRACIKHYGAYCQACEVDFGKKYGPIGEGYIHVHHIKPIHQCGGEYIVDPIDDLVPVCANCHAMLHRRSDPLTVAELRAILQSQKNMGFLN